jgi:hypothetical protein
MLVFLICVKVHSYNVKSGVALKSLRRQESRVCITKRINES